MPGTSGLVEVGTASPARPALMSVPRTPGCRLPHGRSATWPPEIGPLSILELFLEKLLGGGFTTDLFRERQKPFLSHLIGVHQLAETPNLRLKCGQGFLVQLRRHTDKSTRIVDWGPEHSLSTA